MSFHFVFVICVFIVLAQGSYITQVEPVFSVETHSAGDVSSGAAITFPEVRPAPGSKAKSPAVRPVAPRLVATSGRRQTGSNSRPAVGGGANYAHNRNWIQKPY
ncbi:uncharacterized protein LOC26535854 [Drosophila yakuba]|uniref:Uncharacterized protein n=1 Tax=Drosophila yakuba TaxID=7245 RepID=A0A0R1E8P3_DROYA|nr:uncharacterized protein LOC26535854 [Drosophila yakuba]KRK03938.1 uncharacterized protein Dyak_GE28673 [Drosophila yakuba]